jgi:hypothetical protein
MGRYSKFKDDLTKFSEESTYQDKVNSKKNELLSLLTKEKLNHSPSNLGNLIIAAKLEKKKLQALEKEQNLVIEAINQILVERLESEDLAKVSLSNGVTLSIKDDVYCTVRDKPAFYEWIKSTGQEDLFTVNFQTMSSMTKSMLVEGKEIPPGIKTYFKQSIHVRELKGLEDDGD